MEIQNKHKNFGEETNSAFQYSVEIIQIIIKICYFVIYVIFLKSVPEEKITNYKKVMVCKLPDNSSS